MRRFYRPNRDWARAVVELVIEKLFQVVSRRWDRLKCRVVEKTYRQSLHSYLHYRKAKVNQVVIFWVNVDVSKEIYHVTSS